MTTMSKREYLQRVLGRYQRARREHKGRILAKFCAVCGYGRKWAIKLLNRLLAAAPVKRGGAPQRYGEELVAPLKQVWQAAQQPCGKRLREALPLWLPHLKLSQRRRALLLQASAATLDRLLSALKVSGGQRRRGTKPGELLKTQIPIRTSNADIDRPGYLEMDTVAHCGGSWDGHCAWLSSISPRPTSSGRRMISGLSADGALRLDINGVPSAGRDKLGFSGLTAWILRGRLTMEFESVLGLPSVMTVPVLNTSRVNEVPEDAPSRSFF